MYINGGDKYILLELCINILMHPLVKVTRFIIRIKYNQYMLHCNIPLKKCIPIYNAIAVGKKVIHFNLFFFCPRNMHYTQHSRLYTYDEL